MKSYPETKFNEKATDLVEKIDKELKDYDQTEKITK